MPGQNEARQFGSGQMNFDVSHNMTIQFQYNNNLFYKCSSTLVPLLNEIQGVLRLPTMRAHQTTGTASSLPFAQLSSIHRSRPIDLIHIVKNDMLRMTFLRRTGTLLIHHLAQKKKVAGDGLRGVLLPGLNVDSVKGLPVVRGEDRLHHLRGGTC